MKQADSAAHSSGRSGGDRRVFDCPAMGALQTIATATVLLVVEAMASTLTIFRPTPACELNELVRRVTPSQPLDTPLWAFSLAVYGGDGVADECLALQERLGLDVNILLLAAYIGAVEGVRFEVSDIAAANVEVAPWQAEIVRPLRQVRRALKPMNAEGLRAQVKAAELDGGENRAGDAVAMVAPAACRPPARRSCRCAGRKSPRRA